MSRISDGIFETQFCTAGDKAVPPFNAELDGFPPSYSQAGGDKPERTTFNQLFNQLIALGVDVNTMGAALAWDSTVNYAQYALVTGSDGSLYTAVISNTGVDPVTDAGSTWTQVPNAQTISDLIASYASEGAGGSAAGTTLIGHTGQTLFQKLTDLDNELTIINQRLDSIDDENKVLAVGYIAANGTLGTSFGISNVIKIAGGVYDIYLTTPVTSETVVSVLILQQPPGSSIYSNTYTINDVSGTNVVRVFCTRQDSAGNTANEDYPFSFTAFKPGTT